jgi:G3E family GTPase
MVKIDLITGFLGAGKTTFIREYAKFLISKGERICIIENDYGAVNIDMVLLQDLLGEKCNLEMIVGGDGQEAHRRRFRTKLISMGMSGYDRVLIEPSGIYDVDEFFDVLYDEPLDRWYEIGSVISLVDTQAIVGLSGFERYVFMSEIANAGKLVYTKMSDPASIQEVTDKVNEIMTEYGGKAFDLEHDIIAKPFNEYTQSDYEILQNCGYRHASYVKIPIEDKQFTPLFYFDVEMPEDKLKEISQSLFTNEDAGNVIRIKGFVKTGEGSQVEINATEKETALLPSSSSRNVLIIIGERLDKEYINSKLKNYCSVVSL